MVCIDVAVPGTYAVGDDDSFIGIQDRPDHRGIAGPIVFLPDQGLDYAPSLYLMIVLADDGFLTADVEPREHPFQGFREVLGDWQLGLLEALGFPSGIQPHLGKSRVQEIHIQVSNGPSPEEHVEFARVGECSQNRGLYIHPLGQLEKGFDLRGGHGQGHSFLGLGQQDFPRIESGVLQWCLFQFEPTTDVPSHLPHGG